jgi:hypothetical protein
VSKAPSHIQAPRSYATASPVKKTSSTRTKSTTKSKTAKKPTIKAKAKAKAKPKPKPKKRVRKPLTEEAKLKVEIRELKKIALVKPKQLPDQPYIVLAGEMAKEHKGLAAKEASERYKNFSASELEVRNSSLFSNLITTDGLYYQDD